MLLDLLKGYERDPFDRTVDIRVGRLRRKIEPDPANPVFIRTVRGEGYLFNPRGDTGLIRTCAARSQPHAAERTAGWSRCSSRSSWWRRSP